MKRGGRLSPTSKKRLDELAERPAIRKAVFDRDKVCRVAGPDCFGLPTVHHLLKASQGGAYSEENLVMLCAHHNTMVEDAPIWAYEMGLVIHSWEAS